MWLLKISVSTSCPWAVSCWHGTTEHSLPPSNQPLTKAVCPAQREASTDTAGDCVPKATFAVNWAEDVLALLWLSRENPAARCTVLPVGPCTPFWLILKQPAVLGRREPLLGSTALLPGLCLYSVQQQKQNRAEPGEAQPEQLSTQNKAALPAAGTKLEAGRGPGAWLNLPKVGKLRPRIDTACLGCSPLRTEMISPMGSP